MLRRKCSEFLLKNYSKVDVSVFFPLHHPGNSRLKQRNAVKIVRDNIQNNNTKPSTVVDQSISWKQKDRLCSFSTRIMNEKKVIDVSFSRNAILKKLLNHFGRKRLETRDSEGFWALHNVASCYRSVSR